MRPAEMSPWCEPCQDAGRRTPADYCDSIPDASVPGRTPSECGYRLVPLCWIHAAERREVATSRVSEVLIDGGVARLDHDRAGGDCQCLDCGRRYYDHPPCATHPFLTVLCDGSVVKL